jgi:hypothetical protein
MGGTPAAILTASLLLAALPAFTAQVMDVGAVRRATQEPTVVATDSKLTALAADGRVSELALRLQRVSTDRTLEPAAREWLLDRGLHELARLAPTPAARSVVEQLVGRRPEVFARVDPDHGDRAVPLYDTGATARFVLRAWQRAQARAQAEADLAAGRTAISERFAARVSADIQDPERAGIVEAFEAAPRAQLAVQRNAIAATMATGGHADEIALVLARRLVDADLAKLIIGHAEPRIALGAVRSLTATFDPQTALGLLQDASRRADIASAALLAIGTLARHDHPARTILLEQIVDPLNGPSAAAALASVGDPAIAAEIGRRLRASTTDQPRRLHVLALKLDASPAARDELRRFLAARQGSAKLRSDVLQWLER